MGGDIQLYSKRGEGSRFVVRLYLPTLPSVEVSALAAPVSGYLGRRQRVLIVDDEAAHRGVLRAMLQPLGFLIEEVDSGAACLAVLAERTPDLLLLDISLRDTTGWVICRQLREAGHSTLAIVIVSANAHDNTEQARAQSGCNGFVTKPVAEADLLEQVRSALGIEWLHAAPAAAPRIVPPGPDVLRELLALAAGGYPRALRARLEELGNDSPDLAPWAARCLALIGTDDAALTATLSQTLQDHAFS